MIGKTNSGGVAPTGTLNISENGTYNVSAFAEAVVSVPGLVPSGTLEISSNGVYDVGSYASASVNVSSGGEDTLAALMTGTISSYVGPLRYNAGYYRPEVPAFLFQSQSNLKTFRATPLSVTTNNHVLVIGSSAFQSCINLEECDLLSKTVDNNNNYIMGMYSDYAFANCTKLSTPVMNISYVGNYAFMSCHALSKVRFTTAQSLWLTVYTSAFAYCSSLSDIFISAYYITINASAFAGTPVTHLSSMFSSPNAITANNYAFASMDSLVDATVNLVYFNAEGVFRGCSKLQTVSISTQYTCTTIPGYAFYDCKELTSVYVSNLSTTLSVGYYAFYQCYSLTSFPYDHITSYIGQYAFLFAGIKSFVTDKELTFGGRNIFGYSKFLYFSAASVRGNISSRAFENCWSLSYVNLGNFSSVVQSSAFYACSSLKSILFSNLGTANNFYNNCFYGCRSLESLYLFGSVVTGLSTTNALIVTPLSRSDFLGYFGSIYVKASLLDSYKTATNWVQYSDRFVGLTDGEIETIISAYNNVPYVEPEE